MNERAIFIEALDREVPEDRAAYLDAACAGDPALRARVEALLRSHEQAGEFPGKLAPQRLAEEFTARESEDTRTEPSGADADGGLDFLEPSDKHGSIGRLGHYEVREVIGRGGMGIVLKAFDERLHRVVAIKVMATQLAASATARRRFTREARAAAAVTHDHVVTIHAVEDAGSLPFIVMQFVAGVSLQDRLDQTGPLQLQEALRIGMQTAAGLAAAHAQGLVHRDVKPANILLENGVERVKLTDFGLARAADDASLTQSGMIAGTPQYMSPEQAEGKPIDHRSDLFSLGSVLYAMCAGRPPFRGNGSWSILKRVREDAPPPLREANPEVPDWLIALIAKLLAKDPTDRYQSATEVAEILGRHLAHVQHPSLVPLPAAPSPLPPSGAVGKGIERGPARRWHQWAAAAAVLVPLLAALGATEATGVTHIRDSVIRIFTSEGTLVVETDDPAVKVVVEGDGDLVITGAGPQEVRLRAGSYRLRATKDGQPVKLDRDLVTITRGDKQIVRVRLEDETPAVVASSAERGAFVRLGGQGVAERRFDTLAEAVQSASDGDTIEVRGNGPFVTEAVSLGRKGLTIRAAAGFRPVIKRNAVGASATLACLLRNQGPLVLEGLELHITGSPGSITVMSERGPLHVANCRFVLYGSHSLATDTPSCAVRNCEFIDTSTGGNHVSSFLPKDGHLRLENNVLGNPLGHTLSLQWRHRGVHNSTVYLRHNTVVSPDVTILQELMVVPESAEPGAAPGRQPVQVHASENLFDSNARPESVFSLLLPPASYRQDAKPLSAEEAERLLPRLMVWREDRNLYCKGLTFQSIRRVKDPSGPEREFIDEPLPAGRTLADWQRMWKAGDSGSAEGDIRYEGGDVLAKMVATPERITPNDFRLRPDSAGYRAGKDKKDLGADIDLVGPGPAYARWKKTPDYQQWLKETGQLKK